MASNVGNVTVTVKIDDALRERVITVLKKARLEPDERLPEETNAEIDAVITELKKEPKQGDFQCLNS